MHLFQARRSLALQQTAFPELKIRFLGLPQDDSANFFISVIKCYPGKHIFEIGE